MWHRLKNWLKRWRVARMQRRFDRLRIEEAGLVEKLNAIVEITRFSGLIDLGQELDVYEIKMRLGIIRITAQILKRDLEALRKEIA